ncbi:hypothetical protein GCM10009738_46110 [Kitasatospora viridis]
MLHCTPCCRVVSTGFGRGGELEVGCPVDPLMYGCRGPTVRSGRVGEVGRGSMERRTVVRCAEGHVFSTGSFPLRNLGARLGPQRLLRCPRCGRLRSAVPVEE